MQLTLLKNGWVYAPTGEFRRADVIISGDRIAQVLGADDTTPGFLTGHIEVDLDEQFLIPGFVDTHFHLTSLALKRLRCDLSEADSADDVVERLGLWARENDAPFLIGVGWDEREWKSSTFPTRETLDSVDPKRPVLARRICGHTGVVNTAFLEHLTDHQEFIDKDTGVVREHALWDAGRMCDPPAEQFAASFEPAIRELHALGITGIHDIVTASTFATYLDGVGSSSAPLRIDVLLHTHPREFGTYKALHEEHHLKTVRLVGVKCFLDGSLGGWTAALNAPYLDGEGDGVLLIERDEFQSIVNGCYERDIVCAAHAIGDRAIDLALDVIAEAPTDKPLFRIEHCEMIGDTQLAKLKGANVYLGLQPNFVWNWGARGNVYEQRLGNDRLVRCNPFRTLSESGVDYIFGSDGMPPGPLYGMQGATLHPTDAERLTPVEAIDRYTRLPNAIGRHKREAGTIEKGQLADLVLLSADPLKEPLNSIKVLKTFVGGELVFGGLEE